MTKKLAQELSLPNKVLFRYRQMCTRRDGWRRIFMLLSKYILMRPAWFGDTSTPWRTPLLSVAGVSDDTTVDTARTAASALCGALWPNTANTFELVSITPPGADGDEWKTQEVKNYWEKATHIVRSKIDAHESCFHIANSEYLDDQVVYGTSGIFGEETEDDMCPIRFFATNIETSVIDEGVSGLIDTVYFEHEMTARQVVEKYGYDVVSQRTQALYNSDKMDSYVKVIQAMEPRPGGKLGDRIDNKPYASVHMEYDTKTILKKSGMEELPVFVTRFRKRPGEIYGRSLAMDALPTVKELNVLRRAYSLALEKILDPPLGYYPDLLGGKSQISLSAGARIPLFSTAGRVPDGQPPIFQLYKINEPQTADERIQKLIEQIQIKFLVDRLLDFNNETRMTLGEAQMRGDFRNQALGPIFCRQLIEIYNPLIKWVVKVLYRRGLLGLHPVKDAPKIAALTQAGKNPFVIPLVVAQQLAQSKDPFVVRFISPAARAMKADAMMGMEKLMNFALTMHNAGILDVMDNIDTDKAIRLYQDHCGAPFSIIRGDDAVTKLRGTHAYQQKMMMQLQQQQAQAKIADTQASAAKKYSQAGMPGLAPGAQQQQNAA